VYEAAAVDGATGWRRFRRVTWPLLGRYFVEGLATPASD
jgi:ABC-type sugar transport system permease subunit